MIALLAVASCAHERPERRAPAAGPPSGSGPIAFAASQIAAGRAPVLSTQQLAAVRAVLAASTPANRRKLIVAFPRGIDSGRDNTMVLFYGDPRYPDGVLPGGTTANHVIGGSCNLYYRADDGTEFAAPGDASGCDTWKDSAADLAAKRYGLGN